MLKTLMILALLAQPLCAVSCDIGAFTASQDAGSSMPASHACCDTDDDNEQAEAPECGDCMSPGNLSVNLAVFESSLPAAVPLRLTTLGPTTCRAPKPRPPNA